MCQKGISGWAQMPKTIVLGYFNRKTLALWKITSNKLIEKTKNFKAIFLWTIFKNEWCNSSEKLLSKWENCKIQWKLSAAYQIRFGSKSTKKMRLDNFQRVFAKSKSSSSFSHFFIEFFLYLFPLKLVIFESRPANRMEIHKLTRWLTVVSNSIL